VHTEMRLSADRPAEGGDLDCAPRAPVPEMTDAELEDVRDLPRHQPGCALPGCHSCEANRRREAALDHLIARWKYLEKKTK
jgi:hypothetical protein